MSFSILKSYCNFCDGGLSNIALTLGGEWEGFEPRNELGTWGNSPFIEGDVSYDPRRVSHRIWETLSLKSPTCVAPPVQLNEIQGCNHDSHCDDGNECSIDACRDNFCMVTELLSNCCGNNICEQGELETNCGDCGPFYIEPENYCEECFAMDGFMFEVRLKDDALRDIFINSISFMHTTPSGEDDVTIALYSTLDGSYAGKEVSNSGWRLLSTIVISNDNRSDSTDITVNPPLRLNAGLTKAFYLSASEDVILFGQGAYSLQNDHGVELFSSRAVSGLFGEGIEGFSLSCSIEYVLSDSLSTPSPTTPPTTQPTESMNAEAEKKSKGTPERDSSVPHSSNEDDDNANTNSVGRKQHFPRGSLLVAAVLLRIAIDA